MTGIKPYDPEGLWIKAKLFINRAMDDDREFEEAAFWATSALEMLGKCALARHSPLLIANPIDDGTSLLAASGLLEDTGRFQSVQAKTVWSRCARAFKPFSEPEAKLISAGRNDYIHSASMGFAAIPEKNWWGRYWAQAAILLNHIDRDVSDFVGSDRARVVERHLSENKLHMERRLEAILATARTRLRLHHEGSMSGRVLIEWNQFRRLEYSMFGFADCPACGETAEIGGTEVLDRDVKVSGWDDGDVSVTLNVATEELACPECHLRLGDYELLELADVPTSFDCDGSIDDVSDLFEDEYNNE